MTRRSQWLLVLAALGMSAVLWIVLGPVGELPEPPEIESTDETTFNRPTSRVPARTASQSPIPREHRAPVSALKRISLALESSRYADPVAKSLALEQLAATVADRDLGAVLRSLKPEDLAGEFAALLMRRWAANDPHAAAEWARSLVEGPARAELISQLVTAWMDLDRVTAINWVKALEPSPSRTRGLSDLASAIAPKHPVTALQLGLELPAGAERDRLLNHSVSEWVAQDARAAVQWVGQIEDNHLRDQLLAALAPSLAEQNPRTAAAVTARWLPPGATQERAVMTVVQRWAQQEPSAAAEWVEKFPAGQLRETALEILETKPAEAVGDSLEK